MKLPGYMSNFKLRKGITKLWHMCQVICLKLKTMRDCLMQIESQGQLNCPWGRILRLVDWRMFVVLVWSWVELLALFQELLLLRWKLGLSPRFPRLQPFLYPLFQPRLPRKSPPPLRWKPPRSQPLFQALYLLRRNPFSSPPLKPPPLRSPKFLLPYGLVWPSSQLRPPRRNPPQSPLFSPLFPLLPPSSPSPPLLPLLPPSSPSPPRFPLLPPSSPLFPLLPPSSPSPPLPPRVASGFGASSSTTDHYLSYSFFTSLPISAASSSFSPLPLPFPLPLPSSVSSTFLPLPFVSCSGYSAPQLDSSFFSLACPLPRLVFIFYGYQSSHKDASYFVYILDTSIYLAMGLSAGQDCQGSLFQGCGVGCQGYQGDRPRPRLPLLGGQGRPKSLGSSDYFFSSSFELLSSLSSCLSLSPSSSSSSSLS